MESTHNGNHVLKDSPNNVTTVYETEVKHFSEDYDIWWNVTGPRKGLHALNKVRVPYVCQKVMEARKVAVNKLEESLLGLRVLDAGCGGGILTEALANCGATVVGLDASSELIEVAKGHAAKNPLIRDRVEYVATTIEEYATKHKESFDVVVSSEVVEHVSNPDKFVLHCCELLKPGGSIIITTINKTLWAWLSTIVYLEWITNTIKRGTHNWNQYVSPEEVTAWVTRHGCEGITVQGTKLVASPLGWELQSSTSEFYMLHAVKREK